MDNILKFNSSYYPPRFDWMRAFHPFREPKSGTFYSERPIDSYFSFRFIVEFRGFSEFNFTYTYTDTEVFEAPHPDDIIWDFFRRVYDHIRTTRVEPEANIILGEN